MTLVETCESPASDWADRLAPSLAEIERMAHDAVQGLPEIWREGAASVVLRVEDFPSDEVLEAMDLQDPFELTGMYEGIPLTEKSFADQPVGPDMVWLYRRPILEEWIERGNVALEALVVHVVVHEMAHHFGWSDEDIAKIDPWWE